MTDFFAPFVTRCAYLYLGKLKWRRVFIIMINFVYFYFSIHSLYSTKNGRKYRVEIL